MLKNDRFTLRIFSKVLAATLISSVLIGVQSAGAVDAVQIHTPAELLAAGIDPATVSIKITGDIALTANLVINHSMSITRGDLLTTSPTISGFGVEISSASTVTMDHLKLTGTDVQADDGNYGVMVQGGSHLTASYLEMALNTAGQDNDGFNVAAGSTLSLSNSSITWGAGVTTVQQYGVYAQSGAGAITLASNTFLFNSTNVGGSYSYLIGTQGVAIANYPVITMTGNIENAYMQFLLLGADTAVNKQAWANTYVTATAGKNRIGMTAGVAGESGIYSRSATGWSKNINVNDEATLRAGVLIPNSIITFTGDVILTSTNLVIASNLTINGNGKSLSGLGVELNSGAVVTMDSLTVTGVNTQPEGTYLVMIQGASNLTASYLTMNLGTAGADNTAFNVASGSTLSLSHSTLTWTEAGVQQFAVYAQSGAVAVNLISNNFAFNASNSSGAYSYLIGVEGALVANYPVVTLTSNTKNSLLNFLISGADTVAHKQVWANSNVTTAAFNNQVGIIDGTSNGIYTKFTENWGVNYPAQFVAASAVADSVVNLGADITLAANLVLASGVAIHYNGHTFSLAGFEITTSTAPVVTITRDVITVVNGTMQSSQVALVAVPTSVLLQLKATTTMTSTGGNGDGAVSYLTTSPAVCSVTSAGVVTAISAGSCLITATKAASGNYFAAISSPIAITVSDSVAVAEAKVAADKAIADAAQAAAEKAIADKAEADAAAEAAANPPIVLEEVSSIRYAIGTKTKTIFINLPDTYADQLVIVEVKKLVLKNGKYVLGYVEVDTVVLDQFGYAKIKTLIDIKVGNVIRVSALDDTKNIPIKYVTVK